VSTHPVPPSTVRRVVELATRAPSVHNTQPWRWRATDRSLEVHADWSRQLHASDPTGRNLLISCGAALHHAQVAAEALGWSTEVRRAPEADGSDLLARLVLFPAPQSPNAKAKAKAKGVLESIESRRTDRRRFTSWPVPAERLHNLASSAADQGATALPLTDVTHRFRTERLVDHATELMRTTRSLVQEQEEWLDRSSVDGVPSAMAPELPGHALTPASRFAPTELDDLGDRDLEGTDGLIALVDTQDAPSAWLTAGEGLSALWLRATLGGLSVVPLSQVVEVDETRDAFTLDVLGGRTRPLLLLRIGWQSMGRGGLPRTPRRPVDDVLTWL